MQVKLRYPKDEKNNPVLNAFKFEDKELYTVCQIPGTTEGKVNYTPSDFVFLYTVVEE